MNSLIEARMEGSNLLDVTILFLLIQTQFFGNYHYIFSIVVLIYLLFWFIIYLKEKEHVNKPINKLNLILVLAFLLYAIVVSKFFGNFHIKGIIEFNAVTLYGIYLSKKYTFEGCIKVLFIFSFILLVINLICVVFFKWAISLDERYINSVQGIFEHRNVIGSYMIINIAVSLIYMTIWSSKKIKIISYINILGAAYLIYKTYSSTTIIVMLVMIALYLAFRYINFKVSPILVTFIILIFNYILVNGLRVDGFINNFLMRTFNKDVTFTGRSYVWAIALNYIQMKPIWGYGFEGFFGDYIVYFPNEVTVISHSHNGLLQILIDLGIVGLTMFICIVYRTLKKVLEYREYNKVAFLPILSMFIFCLTEPYLLTYKVQIFWLVLIILLLSEAVEGGI